MSDASQGPGWWIASDGRWYPPELHPHFRPPPPESPYELRRRLPAGERRSRTLKGDFDCGWLWFRSRSGTRQAVLAGVVLLIGASVVATAIDEEDLPSVMAGPPTTVPAGAVSSTTAEAAPTTTLSVLPAGDDRTVARVTDGDSLVVDDGTRIRLIGVNTPEVETGDCYSAEATTRLTELVPAATKVRLVYDAERLDRFGRTLAYVYRHTDGLFVNAALARDGTP